MNCPKCGFVQPDGMPDCQRCQIIFAKWQVRQNQAAETMALPEAAPPSLQRPVAPPPGATPPPAMSAGAPAAPPNDYLPQHTYIPEARNYEPEAPKRNWGTLAALIGAALLVAWLGWKAMVPGRGTPVPEGAYRDPGQAFAMVPPAEWITVTPDNIEEISRQHAGSIPGGMRQALSGGKALLFFIKLMPGREGGDNINIVTMKQQMPRLSESDRKAAETEIVKSVGSQFSGFKVNHSELVTLDKLQALRITSEASVFDPSIRRKINILLVQAMVPGNGRTYVITCTTDLDQSGGESSCNQSIESFRVLKRPSLLGGKGIFNGALKGALVGAAIGLAVGFIKWAFGGE